MAKSEPPNPDVPNPATRFTAGTQLLKEGEYSRRMYIIQEGKVRVYKTSMNQRITLAVLSSGEVFGELSFFDAEPRSASVEALTDVSAIVVDGADLTQEIAGLPSWIFPILRATFQRFREADRKITILQHINEYQKKSFRTDNVGKTIYLELLRFIKAFEVLCANAQAEGRKEVKSDALFQELDEVLGNRSLGLRVFWRQLSEHDFIDHEIETNQGRVVINTEALGTWKNYLLSEVSSERYLLLSHTAVALLGRIAGFIHTPGHADARASVEVPFAAIRLENMPFHKEALDELSALKIIEVKKTALDAVPALLYPLYVHQSILKAFDHSTMNVS